MHLSAWPLEEFPALEAVLGRLHLLCPDPPSKVQTHLLHLASYGEILPHVDNLEASGSWILGVSLGDARTLRMKEKGGESGKEFSWKLPSGSVYLQRLVAHEDPDICILTQAVGIKLDTNTYTVSKEFRVNAILGLASV